MGSKSQSSVKLKKKITFQAKAYERGDVVMVAMGE